MKKRAFLVMTKRMGAFLYSLKQPESFCRHQILFLDRNVAKEGLLFPIVYTQVLFNIFIVGMCCFSNQKRNEGMCFVENRK